MYHHVCTIILRGGGRERERVYHVSIIVHVCGRRKREMESVLGLFKADAVNEADAERARATPALETKGGGRGREKDDMYTVFS
jgi:hypothetical protein